MISPPWSLLFAALAMAWPLAVVAQDQPELSPDDESAPYLVVLGIAQDGGVPQAGSRRADGLRRWVTALAAIDPASGDRLLFEATPDLREQLAELDRLAPVDRPAPGLAGVFLTHAHIGHYAGLMFFGHESIGAREVPVWAMPRMRTFLSRHGPWSQLVEYRNIALQPLAAETPVRVGRFQITALPVPHRDEFSEVVGYRIDGPNRSVLFVPDIDSWTDWDERGVLVEDLIRSVDVAFLDATFYADGEIPGRDMSGFPHPRVVDSMLRFAKLPAAERAKIRFIHLNHTNPALTPGGAARQAIEARGFRVAEEGEILPL